MEDEENARGGDKIEPSVSAPISGIMDAPEQPSMFYAVARGHLPGIYLTEEDFEKQVEV